MSYFSLFFFALYLILVLVSVVKITESFKGALSSILMLLLTLELLMLVNFTILLTCMQMMTLSGTFLMAYLTFSVGEASFGLGLLINFTRKTGDNMLKCLFKLIKLLTFKVKNILMN